MGVINKRYFPLEHKLKIKLTIVQHLLFYIPYTLGNASQSNSQISVSNTRKGRNWGSEKLRTCLWSLSSWQSWAMNSGITDSGPEHLTTGSDNMRNPQWHYRHNTCAGKGDHPRIMGSFTYFLRLQSDPSAVGFSTNTEARKAGSTDDSGFCAKRSGGLYPSPTSKHAFYNCVNTCIPTRRLVRQAWSLTQAALAVTGLKLSPCGVHLGL